LGLFQLIVMELSLTWWKAGRLVSKCITAQQMWQSSLLHQQGNRQIPYRVANVAFLKSACDILAVEFKTNSQRVGPCDLSDVRSNQQLID